MTVQHQKQRQSVHITINESKKKKKKKVTKKKHAVTSMPLMVAPKPPIHLYSGTGNISTLPPYPFMEGTMNQMSQMKQGFENSFGHAMSQMKVENDLIRDKIIEAMRQKEMAAENQNPTQILEMQDRIEQLEKRLQGSINSQKGLADLLTQDITERRTGESKIREMGKPKIKIHEETLPSIFEKKIHEKLLPSLLEKETLPPIVQKPPPSETLPPKSEGFRTRTMRRGKEF